MTTTTPGSIEPAFGARLFTALKVRGQMLLDESTRHTLPRWVGFIALLGVYGLRVYYLQGFYIVTYGLGIYMLNLFIGFLQPQEDLTGDGPSLPTSRDDEEFRPFVRRVPEFRFWWSAVKAVCIAFVMTFFGFFDIPVFWPILLLYFIVLFAITMKRQIKHMLEHGYIPISWGKKKYSGKTTKKKQPVAAMPRVRPPIRAVPSVVGGGATSTLKKVNRD